MQTPEELRTEIHRLAAEIRRLYRELDKADPTHELADGFKASPGDVVWCWYPGEPCSGSLWGVEADILANDGKTREMKWPAHDCYASASPACEAMLAEIHKRGF